MFLPYDVEPTEDPIQQRPWLTWGLLVLLVAVHVVLYLFLSRAAREDIWWRFGVVRFDFHWYQAFTCTLLHGGAMHLVGNGYFLWVYGGALEKTIRWPGLLLVYVLGAAGSMFMHLLTVPPHMVDETAIGASGAISAVLGAFFVIMPRAKLHTMFFSVLSFKPIHIMAPGWVIVGMWFLGQIIYTLGFVGEIEGIAFWAHVSGFVAGAAVGTVVRFRRNRALKRWIHSVRQPYLDAWQSWLRGDPSAAKRQYETIADEPLPEAAGGKALLGALLAVHFPDDDEPALPRLQRAFAQARDYGETAKAVTVYLQMLQITPAAFLPAAYHRDAGFAAVSLKLPQVALFAFQQALAQGMEERRDQLLRALAGIYRQQDRPELADEISAWITDTDTTPAS